ncbi:MAG TPA: VWA domain-containing protein [Acidimicrobiales bacterium]|nr:VWA domain-containing protein [Acidimicrobiales bacterium]
MSTGAPAPAGAGPDLADVVARFGRLLHSAGVPVTPERAGRLAAAMVLAPPATTGELYWLARVTLLSDRGGVELFDRVFARVFGGMVDPAGFRGDRPPPGALQRRTGSDAGPTAERPGPASPQPPGPLVAGPGPGGPDGSGDEDRAEAVLAAFSPDEVLRRKDFAELTPDELYRLRVLAARLAVVTPRRRSRRTVRHRHGDRVDPRATLRRARRSGGEPARLIRRRRRTRSRRLVLLCDVSGSMDPFSRVFLQLMMSGVAGARAEAFVFATRLTRLTPALKGVVPGAAMDRAGRAAPDWSGGTRIGEAIKAFNDRHGRRGMARGAVVVIVSDGWDTGDPAVLGREMERLHRLAYRIVWVNPRKAAPGYAPLVAGMAAARPHVDAFVSGHNLVALEEVLEAVAALRG